MNFAAGLDGQEKSRPQRDFNSESSRSYRVAIPSSISRQCMYTPTHEYSCFQAYLCQQNSRRIVTNLVSYTRGPPFKSRPRGCNFAVHHGCLSFVPSSTMSAVSRAFYIIPGQNCGFSVCLATKHPLMYCFQFNEIKQYKHQAVYTNKHVSTELGHCFRYTLICVLTFCPTHTRLKRTIRRLFECSEASGLSEYKVLSLSLSITFTYSIRFISILIR